MKSDFLLNLTNADGDLFSPIQMTGWYRPSHVRLIKSQGEENGGLIEIFDFIEGTGEDPTWVDPKHDLLERFLDLPDASDEEISQFAARYGGLRIFCKNPDVDPPFSWVENCCVWRYFAAAMQAILKIAYRYSEGQPIKASEMIEIASFPKCLETRNSDVSDRLKQFSGDEVRWLAEARSYLAIAKNSEIPEGPRYRDLGGIIMPCRIRSIGYSILGT